MRTTTRIAMLSLFIALGAAIPARAEGGSQDSSVLSLQRARELTLSRSATLAKAKLAVDEAGLTTQAQAYAGLPQLSAAVGPSLGYGASSGSAAGASSSGLSYGASAKVTASQTIYDGGKNSDAVKKDELASNSASKALEATRLSLLGQADAAYFAVLEDETSVKAAESDLAAAQLRQSIAQAKIDAAILSKSAYLQTEADTAGYQTALLIAKGNLSSARAKLASLTGLPSSTALEEVDFSAYDALLAKLASLDEPGLDNLASLVSAKARASSPSLVQYALAVQEAELSVGMARKAYQPTVSLGLSPALAYSNPSTIDASGSVSLTATMSLDFWTLKNGVDSAQVASASAKTDAQQGESDLDLQVAQALYAWVASASSIVSSAKALDYAQSNYENVLEQYKLSSVTTSDLSTAEALVSADETSLIKARYGFLSDLSALAVLAGLEDTSKLAALVP